MTHTPNRLAVHENTLAGYGDNGRNFFLVPEGSDHEYDAIAELTLEHRLVEKGETERYLLAKSNARRLVACWNACAGIPIEALETGLVQQSLEVLQEMVKDRPKQEPPQDAVRAHSNWELFNRAREVLAGVS